MEELQRQVKELQDKVTRLEGQMSDYSVTEGLKDRFFNNVVTKTTTTTVVPEGGGNVVVPDVTATLELVYKGKVYKLLYQ